MIARGQEEEGMGRLPIGMEFLLGAGENVLK